MSEIIFLRMFLRLESFITVFLRFLAQLAVLSTFSVAVNYLDQIVC